MENFKDIFADSFKTMDYFNENVLEKIFGKQNCDFGESEEYIKDDSDRKLADGANILSLKKVGTITTNEHPIEVFEAIIKDKIRIARSRVGIQALVRRKLGQFLNAFIIFHYQKPNLKDDDCWRFSYLFKEGRQKDITNPKRFTYLFGKNYSGRTATVRFNKLANKVNSYGVSLITDQDLIEAFSVEVLTQEFYTELYEWYQWAISPESGIFFPNLECDSDEGIGNIEKNIIRLITRLMFVWFIKQKELVPNSLFEERDLKHILKNFDPESCTQSIYYNAILQNLFFATLNRAIEDEDGKRRFAKSEEQCDTTTLYRYAEMFSISETDVIKLFANVPFLNGGLFECMDKSKNINGETIKYNYDGFNDLQISERAIIPNCFFFDKNRGILNILKHYNFTIEENTPLEKTVALDPELLGKVFENLLAVHYSQSKESVRKSTGSYYTPREIVNYMVDENLIAYLGDTPLVRSIFKEDFESDDLHWSDYQYIAGKLKSVKIFDPACGSGAFPMGVLNRIVDIVQRIDKGDSSYKLKLNIIENCIYGSDIQPIATQITKLRFFISLVCDCEKDVSKPNFGIPTLPNLETKFVTANTLVRLSKAKKEDFASNLFENPEISAIKTQLARVRHKHFSAKTVAEKRRLRDKDQELREKLTVLIADNNNFAPDDAKQMAVWNPYDQNASSPFFDVEWMFGINGGFDIVIGNPPYQRIQGIRESNPKLAEYLSKNYKTATGSFDLFVTFVERGLELINKTGIVNYIMPTKWTNSDFGKGLRALLLSEYSVSKIINFGAYQVFNASTYTGIQWFSRYSNHFKYFELNRNLSTNDELKNYLDTLNDKDANIVNIQSLSEKQWVLTNKMVTDILNTIEQQPRKVQDVFDRIFCGLQTSKDDVYFIYDCKIFGNLIEGESKQLNRRIQIEIGLVKPLLKGNGVRKYGTIQTDRFVIFPYKIQDGKAILFSENELLELFPKGYDYLKECEDILRERENGKLLDDIFWYKYIYPKNLVMFENEKLVAPEISMGGNFAYDKEGVFYSTTKVYGYIKKESTKESYKFWMALFNSRLFWFFIQNTGYVLRGGFYTFKTNYVNPFPVPSYDVTCNVQDIMNRLVDYLIYLNNPSNQNILNHTSNTRIASHIMEIVDMVVYELYFEKHMIENGIDIVSYLKENLWFQLSDMPIEIERFYLWYQKPENLIRQRIMLLETRSYNLLYQIHSTSRV